MRIKDLIRRAAEDRAPKPAFARVAGFLGMFCGIGISAYVFNSSLLSLGIGVAAGYYFGELLALALLRFAPERFAITDSIGIWAVRIMSLVSGLGGIALGAQLLIPIRSPWEFDRISGAGFFLVGGVMLTMIAFGKLVSRWPRLTAVLLTPGALVVFVASLVAFVLRRRVFFLGIGLFALAEAAVSLALITKRRLGFPMDEAVWYALSGRLRPSKQ